MKTKFFLLIGIPLFSSSYLHADGYAYMTVCQPDQQVTYPLYSGQASCSISNVPSGTGSTILSEFIPEQASGRATLTGSSLLVIIR
ncbi:MAG: hypothetical protein V4660_16280 [Pseudomonadota bacterium]